MDFKNLSRARVEQKLVYEMRKARSKFAEAWDNGALPWQNLQPCSHIQWLNRTNGRYEPWVPTNFKEHNLPFVDSEARVAAVIHVFYLDLVDELIDHLKNVPVDLDVYVTNVTGEDLDEERFKVGHVQNVAVLEFHNHGRDIASLIAIINAGYLDSYDLVLKMHTKKSAWREAHKDLPGSGEQWKNELLSSLAGSPEQVQKILNAFAADPRLGAVGAPGTILGSDFWGGDLDLTRELGKRIGLPIDADSLQFISGSMYWIRGFVLQGLRSLCLHTFDFHNEEGQVDGTTAHALERLIGLLTIESGLTMQETNNLNATPLSDNVSERENWHRFTSDVPRLPAARFVPFYLPQFHPSKVNDESWGKGFTEWTNVTQGRPAFPGHVQPLVPSELGYYDLRMDTVREQQLALEQYAGIEGFMYYYYWFSGERVLNVPIEALSKQNDLEQPFCLMWANENWTRTWDGLESEVILSQRYDQVPAEDFIDDILEFLKDPRYLRVDGRAILAVYRPAQMSNFKDVVDVWRQRARDHGVGELEILSVDVTKQFDGIDDTDLASYGIDGHLGFPPHGIEWPRVSRKEVNPTHKFAGHLVSYRRMSQLASAKAVTLDQSGFPGVMVNFDNTSRKKWKADIWYGSNPYTFHRWLMDAVDAVGDRPFDRRIVFINAWNEWAESAVLEPTQRWGRTYLQAVRSVAFS